MKLLSKEDPQLWQQLQGFTDAASVNLESAARVGGGGGGGGGEGGGEGGERGGEGGERGGAGGERGGEGGERGGAGGEGGSVEQTLAATLHKLRESTQQIEVRGMCVCV